MVQARARIATGTPVTPSGTGIQTFMADGETGTPVAALFIYNNVDNLQPTTNAQDFSFGVGAATASGEWFCCTSAEDGATTFTGFRQMDENACIKILDPTDGSDNGTAVFSAFVDGGVSVNWTTAPGAAGDFIFCVIFFEAGATDVDIGFQSGVAASNTVASGFAPNLIFTATTFGTAGVSEGDLGISFGVGGVPDEVSGMSQMCAGFYVPDGGDPADTRMFSEDDAICANGAGTVGSLTDVRVGRVESIDATGFEINEQTPTKGVQPCMYLALNIQGAFAEVVSKITPTHPGGTGSSVTIDTPFQGAFGGAVGTWNTVVGSIESAVGGSFSIGLKDDADASGDHMNIRVSPTAAPMEVGNTVVTADQLMRLPAPDGSGDVGESVIVQDDAMIATGYDVTYLRLDDLVHPVYYWGVSDGPNLVVVDATVEFTGAGQLFGIQEIPEPEVVPVANLWSQVSVRLGGKCIDSVDEDSAEAEKIRCVYDDLRKAFIGEHTWNGSSTITTVTSASDALGSLKPNEWSACYFLPTDTEVVFAINPNPYQPTKYKWNLITIKLPFTDALGVTTQIPTRILLANVAVSEIFYGYDIGDQIGAWKAQTRIAFAAYLAWKLCVQFGQSGLYSVLKNEYDEAALLAKSVDGQEGTTQHFQSTPLVDARYIGGVRRTT